MGSWGETVSALVFLAVSLLSTVIQLGALHQLWRWPRARDARDRDAFNGLVRTSLCRVSAALLYVGVGVAALVARHSLPILALSVFSAVQLMWQINARADVRLRRRLASYQVSSEPLDLDPAVRPASSTRSCAAAATNPEEGRTHADRT